MNHTTKHAGPRQAFGAVLSSALLVSCGGSSAAPKTIEITPVALTGSTIDAAVGHTIIVNLKSNATTGAGGKQIVTLKVTKIGSSDPRGTYRQPWSPLPPGASPDFTITVLAK